MQRLLICHLFLCLLNFSLLQCMDKRLLDTSIKNNDLPAVQALLNGNRIDPQSDIIHSALQRPGTNVVIVKALIAAGADVNFKRDGGEYPIVYTAMLREVEMMKFLLTVPGINWDSELYIQAETQIRHAETDLEKYKSERISGLISFHQHRRDLEIGGARSPRFLLHAFTANAAPEAGQSILHELPNLEFIKPVLKRAKELYVKTINPYLKTDYKTIGKMLLDYLHIFEPEEQCIAKNAKVGLLPFCFPQEIIVRVATFMFKEN